MANLKEISGMAVIGFVLLGLISFGCASNQGGYTDSSGLNSSPAGNTEAAGGTAVAKSTFTMGEVAAHSTPADCWVVINGKVANFTSYNDHPGGQKLKDYCGNDATEAYNAIKGGSGHSAYAGSIVDEYAIGALAN